MIPSPFVVPMHDDSMQGVIKHHGQGPPILMIHTQDHDLLIGRPVKAVCWIPADKLGAAILTDEEAVIVEVNVTVAETDGGGYQILVGLDDGSTYGVRDVVDPFL